MAARSNLLPSQAALTPAVSVPSSDPGAAAFLAALFPARLPSEQLHLRTVTPDGRAHSSFYVKDQALLAAATQAAPTAHVYVGVNPRVGSDGSKDGVRRVYTVFGDFDCPKNLSGDPQGRAAWKQEALARLHDLPLPPSAAVDSGGGFQAYWFLDRPLHLPEPADDSRAAEVARAERPLKGLVPFGADKAAAELARILRLPGTRNYKPAYPDGPLPVALVELHAERRYAFEALLGAFPAPTQEPSREALPAPAPLPDDLDDAALLKIAFRAFNGAAIEALWHGDTSAYGGDDSAADLALLNHLAFYARHDPARMERLFGQSALGARDKWIERPDYRQRTIQKALAGCRDDYAPAGPRIVLGRENASPQVPAPPGPGDAEPPAPTWLPDEETPEPPTDSPTSPDQDDGPHLTDWGNARKLVWWHGQDLHYVEAWNKWLVWDGRRWAFDDTGAVLRRAKRTVARIYGDAAKIANLEVREAVAKHAIKSEATAALKALVTSAQSELEIAARSDDFDQHPWLLTVLNGTLDLRTGQLHPHRRADLLTKLAPVTYDPDATCPTFIAFLERVFAGHADLIQYVQKMAGYALTGICLERLLFILWGSGRNGKSTLINVLSALLGEYALATPQETLLTDRKTDIPNDLARLKGARLVTTVETNKNARLDEAKVKALTGGDKITARFMRAEWFEFVPTFKVLLATNYKPKVRESEEAIWDRLRLIPCIVRIPDDEVDPDLLAKLKAEMPGILNWALAGCQLYQREGLASPDAVRQATGRWQIESDLLGRFLEDCCVIQEGALVAKKALHSAYTTWCETDGAEEAISPKLFGTLIAEKGFMDQRTKKERSWVGLRLSGQPEHAALSTREGDTFFVVTHDDTEFGLTALENASRELTPKQRHHVSPGTDVSPHLPQSQGDRPRCGSCHEPLSERETRIGLGLHDDCCVPPRGCARAERCPAGELHGEGRPLVEDSEAAVLRERF